VKILSGHSYFAYIVLIFAILVGLTIILTGCSERSINDSQSEYMKRWLVGAELNTEQSPEQLYQAALKEGTLVIYSVSSRVFDVKESFEKEYPGLIVEIKDIRSNDVVRQMKSNYENENYACDIVLCSDCDGSLYTELIQPGIIYSYIPKDIEPMLSEEHTEGEGKLTFMGEAIMAFYNSEIFTKSPIKNIWELTENKFKGKIIMANPLSSFSTYGFCAMLIKEADQFEAAYEQYTGKTLEVSDRKNAGEIFWEQVATNIVFTNSSDEVLEGIGNSGRDGMMIGFMLSSKLRLQEMGYNFEPIYTLEPFSSVYTPSCVMISGGAKNVNSAKLFIRYLLGGADGTGEGLQPFSTKGTWSVSTDVPDGNDVPISQIDMLPIDEEYIYENREYIASFFEKILMENVGE